MLTNREVVDAFLVNDELDLVALRLDYMSPFVDRFVIAESTHTFTGLPKPLHVTENIRLFGAFADRMTVVTYEAVEGATAWEREEAGRSALRFEAASLPGDSVVLLADVDEFPSHSQLQQLRLVESLVVVPLETFYRRANWRLESDTPWLRCKALPVRELPLSLHQLRISDVSDFLPGAPGAHLSYMGFDAEQLATKLAAFSHTEFQFAIPAAERVLTVSDSLALDHFGRSDVPGKGVLSVISRSEEGEVHAWLRPRRPHWFGGRPRAPEWWREMHAAVIHTAMADSDATLLGRLGNSTTLRHPAARQALIRRARQLAGRVRLATRRTSHT